MNKSIYNIYKPVGLTPLEALQALRKKRNLPSNLKITYAGRLDPMAEGVLILLAGEKVHEKDKFLKLNKVYKAQILFGVSTDTFDILGKIKNASQNLPSIENIKKILKTFKGNLTLPIPPYSSVPINGKPSFAYARAGELNEKSMRSRETEILKIVLGDYKKISNEKILKTITKKINKVSGDFRQKEILKLWDKKLTHGSRIAVRDDSIRYFTTLDLTISCASGTYVRSIAHNLGKQLSCPALLFSLKRESVGKYKYTKSIKI
jgi:tRNA pseudouridine55 synthase